MRKLESTLIMITDRLDTRMVAQIHSERQRRNCTVAASRRTLRDQGADRTDENVFPPYVSLDSIDPCLFNTLIIPDQLGNPHRRDFDPAAVALVRHFIHAEKEIVMW
jgi:DNA polymerase III epsilon subunit-like protein